MLNMKIDKPGTKYPPWCTFYPRAAAPQHQSCCNPGKCKSQLSVSVVGCRSPWVRPHLAGGTPPARQLIDSVQHMSASAARNESHGTLLYRLSFVLWHFVFIFVWFVLLLCAWVRVCVRMSTCVFRDVFCTSALFVFCIRN